MSTIYFGNIFFHTTKFDIRRTGVIYHGLHKIQMNLKNKLPRDIWVSSDINIHGSKLSQSESVLSQNRVNIILPDSPEPFTIRSLFY